MGPTRDSASDRAGGTTAIASHPYQDPNRPRPSQHLSASSNGSRRENGSGGGNGHGNGSGSGGGYDRDEDELHDYEPYPPGEGGRPHPFQNQQTATTHQGMYAYHFDESSMRGSGVGAGAGPSEPRRPRGSFDHGDGEVDERDRALDRERARERERGTGRKSIQSGGSGPHLAKDEQSEDAGGAQAAEKKAKACLGCRRSKHRCIPSNDPSGKCIRCIKRNEECKFKTRLHDEEWQELVTEELKIMSQTIEDLRATVARLQAAPHTPHNPAPSQPSIPGSGPLHLASLPTGGSSTSLISPGQPDQTLGPPQNVPLGQLHSPNQPPSAQMDGDKPLLDRLGVDRQGMPFGGLEQRSADSGFALGGMNGPQLALAEGNEHDMRDAAESGGPMLFTGSADGGRASGMLEVFGQPMSRVASQPSVSSLLGAAGIRGASAGLFSENLFPFSSSNGMSIANASSFLEELGSLTQTSAGGLRDGGDGIGSNDPRMNIVRKGLVDNKVANVLFDFFVETLSPVMYGFTIRTYEYPFLAAGKATITPYILTVLTMVAAERLPAFHPLVPILTQETSETNPVELIAATDPEIAECYRNGETGEEPIFNVELGLGPEEITATAVLASFSTSSESHVAAKAANEWARGFAKGDASKDTRALTLGEMCGYLTPRRWPTRPQSIRLMLFTYVVAVQQSVYRAAPMPRFDPTDLCTELFQPWADRSEHELMQDHVLVAHVRLSLILQAWRKSTDIGPGKAQPPVMDAYTIQDYNSRLDAWMTDLERVGIDTIQKGYLAPIWLYARMVINIAGSSVGHTESASIFCGNAMRAARNLLDVYRSDRLMEQLPLLPPFYIEIFSMGCTILLLRISKSGIWPLSGDDEQVVNSILTASRRLVQGPLPPGHYAPQAGERLQNAVNGLKQRWRAMGAF